LPQLAARGLAMPGIEIAPRFAWRIHIHLTWLVEQFFGGRAGRVGHQACFLPGSHEIEGHLTVGKWILLVSHLRGDLDCREYLKAAGGAL
jgi:hypothetical protein